MVNPNPAEQKKTRDREAAVLRIVGLMPRQIAHTLKDALRMAWNEGNEYAKREAP